jgi:hypothetical protein
MKKCCVLFSVASDPVHPGDGWISGEATRRSEREMYRLADAGLPGKVCLHGLGLMHTQ